MMRLSTTTTKKQISEEGMFVVPDDNSTSKTKLPHQAAASVPNS